MKKYYYFFSTICSGKRKRFIINTEVECTEEIKRFKDIERILEEIRKHHGYKDPVYLISYNLLRVEEECG